MNSQEFIDAINSKTQLEFEICLNDYHYLEAYSKVHKHGDWDAVYTLDVRGDDVDIEDVSDDEKLYVTFGVVRVDQCKDQVDDIAEYFGIDKKDLITKGGRWKKDTSYVAEYMKYYVGHVILREEECRSLDEAIELLTQSRENPIRAIVGMIGFFLDQPQNIFGDSGWKVLEGNYGRKDRQHDTI